MYKITNKCSGNTQIMSLEEKDVFFSHSQKQIKNWEKYGKRNMWEDYDVKEIRFLDNIPTWFIVSGLTVLIVASGLLHIQLNY